MRNLPSEKLESTLEKLYDFHHVKRVMSINEANRKASAKEKSRMAITFTRYAQGQYIYPSKGDGTPFTEAELELLVEVLNDLELPVGDSIPDKDKEE